MAKRKADAASLNVPEALDPTSDARVHKRRPVKHSALLRPRLTFPELVVEPATTAKVAAVDTVQMERR